MSLSDIWGRHLALMKGALLVKELLFMHPKDKRLTLELISHPLIFFQLIARLLETPSAHVYILCFSKIGCWMPATGNQLPVTSIQHHDTLSRHERPQVVGIAGYAIGDCIIFNPKRYYTILDRHRIFQRSTNGIAVSAKFLKYLYK